MNRNINARRLDFFRLAAAFLVVAVHTSPLLSINRELDFFIVHVAARVAVPFFLMVSGFFLLPSWKSGKTGPVKRFFRRTGLLYAAAILLYLPVNLYAGQLTAGNLLKKLVFDGTFYHLWYLPAALLGMALTLLLCGKKRPALIQKALPAAAVLYLIGLFGDSWYGLIQGNGILCKLYGLLFSVSSYTRNGIFFAPLFLMMGGVLRERLQKAGPEDNHAPRAAASAMPTERTVKIRRKSALCTAVFFLLLLLEGGIIHGLALSRHDSMYLTLPFLMWFLFLLLAQPEKPLRNKSGKAAKAPMKAPMKAPTKAPVEDTAEQKAGDTGKDTTENGKKEGLPLLRSVAAWIYILHPMTILVMRGFAGITGTERLFVDNSLIHYVLVCFLSFSAAYVIARIGGSFGNGGNPNRRRGKDTGKDTAKSTSVRSGGPGSGRTQKETQKERTKARSSQTKNRRLLRERGRAWAELDMRALRENVRLLSERIPPDCRLMPAVKANAYGHGVWPVARELNRLGIRAFCVADTMEGVELRKKRICGEILVLGYTHPSQFGLLKRYHLTQTVVDCDYAKLLNRYGRRRRRRMRVHVKVDTGMRRLGEDASHVKRIAALWEYPFLRITGMYTHLCTADAKDRDKEALEFAGEQIARFDALRNALKNRGICCPCVHVQSSYGILNDNLKGYFREEKGYGYARPGIALYGLMSRKEDCKLCKPDSGLSPVLSLYARIETVKTLKKGESAGYGRAYIASEEKRIAALSVGYADGIPGSIVEKGAYVLIGGKKAPVIGRICMDQMLVDVTGIREAAQGGVAVLIGSAVTDTGQTCRITAEDMAEWAGIITNELVSRLGPRIRRIAVNADETE